MIALFGVPDSGQAPLFEALADSAARCGWPACVVMGDPGDPGRCDLTLLMGLGRPHLPALADADQSIRRALASAGSAYEVLYGTPQDKLTQALQLIQKMLPAGPGAAVPAHRQMQLQQRPWAWRCNQCSDSQCEQKLLTQLLSKRSTAR